MSARVRSPTRARVSPWLQVLAHPCARVTHDRYTHRRWVPQASPSVGMEAQQGTWSRAVLALEELTLGRESKGASWRRRPAVSLERGLEPSRGGLGGRAGLLLACRLVGVEQGGP